MSLKLNERYPGRFNNPSADYPSGSFKNRTTPDAKDGSYLEKDWANDKEGFFQSLLSTAGITASGIVDKVGASQFFDALQQLKQNQSGVAFTTTGPSAALVLSPIPAITSYSAGQRFRIKFNRASTGTDTINISGIGPKILKQYDAAGAKVAAVFAIDQLADVEYDGTDAVLLDQLPAAANNLVGIAGAAKNLKVSTTGASAVVTVSADELVVESYANAYATLRSVVVSPSFATAGANGLDVGAANSQTASTWYAVWVIWNGTTKAGLLSLSGTSPTLPAGYTHAARVAWVRTDATANKYPFGFTQAGRSIQYKIVSGGNLSVYPNAGNGTTGGNLIPSSVTGLIPPTAGVIKLSFGYLSGSIGTVFVGANTSTVSGTPQTMLGSFIQTTNNVGTAIPLDIVLESSNIYWSSNTSAGYIICRGWEDNL